MSSFWSKLLTCALVGSCAAHVQYSSSPTSSRSCNVTQIEGCNATGETTKIDGIDIYHAYPLNQSKHDDEKNSSTAILFLTDFYGIASINNKLLADHLALATLFPVIMPDLFNNDPGPQLNLTEWFAQHPTWQIDQVVEQTTRYMQTQLGITRIGAVGYCLGGKHVARFMTSGKGIDFGFVAHPANLTDEEVQAIARPISVAAGELDDIFDKTGRRRVEDILEAKNATYRTSVFSGAPHGFAVRPDVSIPEQLYAKQGAYEQAVSWFDFWF